MAWLFISTRTGNEYYYYIVSAKYEFSRNEIVPDKTTVDHLLVNIKGIFE